DRAEVAESPAAGPRRAMREPDVTDDRVELPVAERALRELRHHVRPDSHRLGDLARRRLHEIRRQRSGHVAALRHDLVTAGAVLGEERLALREAPEPGLR